MKCVSTKDNYEISLNTNNHKVFDFRFRRLSFATKCTPTLEVKKFKLYGISNDRMRDNIAKVDFSFKNQIKLYTQPLSTCYAHTSQKRRHGLVG